MAEILPVAATAGVSSDLTVTSAGLTVGIMDADGGVIADDVLYYINLKGSNGQYTRVDGLDKRKPAVFITAPGIYQVQRVASATATGVFSNT